MAKPKRNTSTNSKAASTKIEEVNNLKNDKLVEPPVQGGLILKEVVSNEQPLYRIREDIAYWRSALQLAESIQYPNRYNLYTLYNDIVLDSHLTSVMDARKKAILSSIFTVTRNGVVDEALTEWIKDKWFYDFTDLALDSIFWGHSLIQFGWDKEANTFCDLELIQRQYVKPEYGIVADTPSYVGESYLEGKYAYSCIGVGGKRDLGLLKEAAPIVLWKKQSLSNWAEFQQVLGVPPRYGKTNSRNEEDRQRMASMLQNMGTATWGVFDLDDEIHLVESNMQSPYEIFDKMIERCNSELSKLILNQTSTSDQKSYVGSSEVHERVMFTVNKADLIFIENIYKTQLVPFLIQHGFDFKNCKIEAKADDKMTLQEKSKFDISLLSTFQYTIPPEYILKTYGTPVIPLETNREPSEDVNNVQNKLNDIYGSDL